MSEYGKCPYPGLEKRENRSEDIKPSASERSQSDSTAGFSRGSAEYTRGKEGGYKYDGFSSAGTSKSEAHDLRMSSHTSK